LEVITHQSFSKNLKGNLFKKLFKKKTQYQLILERVLGFFPSQISLYQHAFRHKSVVTIVEKKAYESNERLEFLGDAILDSVISHFLFIKFPYKDEGFLTKLRSRLVSRQMLNNLGVKIGLKELVETNIDKETKSIYGDALEALIGAIYLDKGYLVTQQFILEKLIENHVDLDEVINNETDFKSRVIEYCQKNKCKLAFILTEKEEGKSKIYIAELQVDGVKKGEGQAHAKKQAEQLAAAQFFNTI